MLGFTKFLNRMLYRSWDTISKNRAQNGIPGMEEDFSEAMAKDSNTFPLMKGGNECWIPWSNGLHSPPLWRSAVGAPRSASWCCSTWPPPHGWAAATSAGTLEETSWSETPAPSLPSSGPSAPTKKTQMCFTWIPLVGSDWLLWYHLFVPFWLFIVLDSFFCQMDWTGNSHVYNSHLKIKRTAPLLPRCFALLSSCRQQIGP